MKRRTVSILTFILLVVMISLLSVFMASQAHLSRAEEETIALVEVDHTVKRVNQFYWTTTDQSCFTIDFIDDQAERFYAIVEREGGDIHYFPYQELIKESDAKSITASEIKDPQIMQARLGLYKGKAVWEMTLRNSNQTISYFILDAKTGEWVQTLSNI
ncbi:hypothetical protein [Facklamia hominis]|uniref:hypothetical protein n=1 Tax=Facklamia hominis TaxID=178214 RepID=UPI000354224F|nr:hypothetical protein [Facklamia hominis]EPH12647.1 hypothetical protein HMPREF9260_00235 [Facklamia hominis ACS-120-V-Sch10]